MCSVRFALIMDNLTRLKEMGFTSEQSQQALKLANGDLERAIDYLSSESIQDLVEITNKEDIPDFGNDKSVISYEVPMLPIRSPQLPIVSSTEHRVLKTDMDISSDSLLIHGDIDMDSDDSASEINQITQVEYPINTPRDPGDPVAVLIKLIDDPANWIPPIVQAFIQIDEVKLKLLRQATTTFSSKLKTLIDNLDGDLSYTFADLDLGLDLDDDDDDSDSIVKKIINKLAYEQIENHNDEFFQDLVESEVESNPQNNEQSIKQMVECFEIDSDVRFKNIYDSFNQMFWGRNLEELGDIQINSIGDILTIYYIADNDPYYKNPIEIKNTFFPEIYSQSLVSSLQEKTNMFKVLNENKIKMTTELMNLLIFQGKKIKGFLQQVTEFIKDDIIENDLSRIDEKLNKEKARLNQEISDTIKQMEAYNIKNTQYLTEGLTPYKLILVLISPTDYYYYLKNVNKWVHVTIKPNMTFRQDYVEFEVISATIYAYSSETIMPLYLIYCKESKLTEDFKSLDITHESAIPPRNSLETDITQDK